MKNKTIKILALVFLLAVSFQSVYAQCPMCKIAVESNLKNGGSAGSGLNFGILYLFVMPYLLVGTVGYLWWRNKRKGVDDDKPSPIFSDN